MQDERIQQFIEALWDYYAKHARRSLPWRQPESDGSFDPYKIMVSELMLQQTQVARVIPKYHKFLERFPTVQKLAMAPLGDVLRIWQGLGYNRRAKFLWQSAQILNMLKLFPNTSKELTTLPGVGKNTAGAICAYAFNLPAVFVETNIRTVYIHHFYAEEAGVDDKDIIAILERTIDRENPREFYWALMDYGSHLKATVGNASKASKHFTRQSTFQGSRRQVRGHVIRLLGERSHSLQEIQELITDARLAAVLDELVTEGLIRQQANRYRLG